MDIYGGMPGVVAKLAKCGSIWRLSRTATRSFTLAYPHNHYTLNKEDVKDKSLRADKCRPKGEPFVFLFHSPAPATHYVRKCIW